MEPSSIVSFNNDSTFQTTLKADFNDVSVHELALHAMRDRCLLLQRRILALENDNMKLKLDCTKFAEMRTPYCELQSDEKSKLYERIAELTKQKSQLMHHVFMVTCENKNLWNCLATLKKGSKRETVLSSFSVKNESQTKNQSQLLRTNTYIHSTPKIAESNQDKFSETSLEEISLKLINSYIQEKSQLVEQYEQMSELQVEDDNYLNMDSIGFAYLDEHITDSFDEISSQTDKMLHLKKELSQQESNLKAIISHVEIFLKEGRKCSTCTINSTKKITLENKEIETSDSLANWATPAESTTYNDNMSELTTTQHSPSKTNHLQEHQLVTTNEEGDKICPMCGESFQKDCMFDEFQQHVESHFVGDPEPDSIVDHYDLVTNSVGNFT